MPEDVPIPGSGSGNQGVKLDWKWIAIGAGGLLGLGFFLSKSGGASPQAGGVPANVAVAMGDLQRQMLELTGVNTLGFRSTQQQLTEGFLNTRAEMRQLLAAQAQNVTGQLTSIIGAQADQERLQESIYNYLVAGVGSIQNTLGASDEATRNMLKQMWDSLYNQIGATGRMTQDQWSAYWPYLMALMTHEGVGADDFPRDFFGDTSRDPNALTEGMYHDVRDVLDVLARANANGQMATIDLQNSLAYLVSSGQYTNAALSAAIARYNRETGRQLVYQT